MDKKCFICKLAPFAQADMKKTKVLASLTLAQACLESGFGTSGLAVKANNLFGIKGEYNGQSVDMSTTEYEKGVPIKVIAKFRKYPTMLESISDHSKLFTSKTRYKNLVGCTDAVKACQYVQKDGYATDPAYSDKLMKVIKTYNLTQYDKVVVVTEGKK